MRTDQSPLFRKVIAPWYDSEIACSIMGIFMVLVLCFGCVGVAVAVGNPADQGDVWVPLLLVFMSLYVLISTCIRIVKRKRVGYSRFN